jgi:ABC-2 type transport system permease protein
MLTAVNLLKFVFTCWKLNLSGAMEFRMSFLLTAGMMVLNNTVWIFFWGVYFLKFPIVNGWELTDVMMMWAVGAGGFGLSAVFFGNAYYLASIVAAGQLDIYLAQPKPVLLHVTISRMSVSAIGDIIFALLLYAFFGDLSWLGLIKFAAALMISMLIFLFFTILIQSLAFYIGNAEGIGHQFFISFITLATYPTDIFRGLGRMILFSVIPAGFISYLPIGLMREMQWPFIWGAVFVTLTLTGGALAVFRHGLKRYSSGNMITVRM